VIFLVVTDGSLTRKPRSSSVARVPCALGQEIFLRPLLTKTTEFEVKKAAKILKMQIFFFFEDNKPRLVREINLTKL